MPHQRWHDCWEAGRLGFHQLEINPQLMAHWAGLKIDLGASVLVPLCGKSGDMLHLHGLGHQVVGVELSPVACEAFFVENELAFDREVAGAHVRYVGRESAEGLVVICGDYLKVTPELAGSFDAVYDRAALIALDESMRADYVAVTRALLNDGARGLLQCTEYPPKEKTGPPYSVAPDEVRALYGADYDIDFLQLDDISDMGKERWQLSWLKQHTIALKLRSST